MIVGSADTNRSVNQDELRRGMFLPVPRLLIPIVEDLSTYDCPKDGNAGRRWIRIAYNFTLEQNTEAYLGLTRR